MISCRRVNEGSSEREGEAVTALAYHGYGQSAAMAKMPMAPWLTDGGTVWCT